MADITENLFDAIQTIVDKTIENESFNKTITATIIDNSEAEEGKYLCTDGSVTFSAYSQEKTYLNQEVVYVLLMNGDFSGQKIILGKQVSKKQDTFVSLDPFNSLIDISENLIESIVPIEGSLIANSTIKDKQEILLWQKEYNTPIAGFSKLGVSAKFKSWLSSFQTVAGTYGLKIQLYVKNSNEPYLLYFTNKEMFGDTFNFGSGYKQSKVFDISEINNIINISLYFYQETNSFYNKDNVVIAATDFLGNPVADNLFVTEPYLCLGYSDTEFNKDMVKLYTFNDLTYSSTNTFDKKILLKWLHYENGKVTEITPDSPLNYEIRWYRYELGANDNATAADYDKYVDANWRYIINKTSTSFNYTLIPDLIKESEQIKAVVVDKDTNTVYTSNILMFENTELAIKPDNTNSGLFFTFDDDSNGTYFIYGPGNTILNDGLSAQVRTITAHLANTAVDGTPAHDFLGDEETFEIDWEVPTSNTMLNFDSSTLHSIDLKYTLNAYYSSNYGNNKIICNINRNGVKYSRDFVFSFGNAGTSGSDATLLINFKNNQNALIANTQGEIVEEQITGLNGEAVTEQRLKELTNIPQLELVLYDASNQKLDTSQYSISWSITAESTNLSGLWFYNKLGYRVEKKSNEEPNITISDKGLDAVYLRGTSPFDINDLLIVSATLSGYGTYDLTTYFALPIKSNDQYSSIQGLTAVIYSTLGTPASNNLSYALFKNDEIVTCDWMIHCNGKFTQASNITNFNAKYIKQDNGSYKKISDYEKPAQLTEQDNYYQDLATQALANNNLYELHEDVLKYVGSLYQNENKEYILKPLSMYVQGAPIYGVQAYNNSEVLWTQPILVLQNSYPSKTINKWDGKTVSIDEDNGSIVSPMIAAGKKNNDDNTFTGVLMGDYSGDATGELPLTGLYGMYKGTVNYAFMENGTGFIGPSGRGRINFDGVSSRIYNSGYFNTEGNKSGLLIDLDNPYISVHDLNGNEIILINSKLDNNYSSEPYLKIAGKKQDGSLQTILNVDENNYYFASIDPFTTSMSANNIDENNRVNIKAILNGTYLNLTNGFFATKTGILGSFYFNQNGLINASNQFSINTEITNLDTTTLSINATDDNLNRCWILATTTDGKYPGFYTPTTQIYRDQFINTGYATFKGISKFEGTVQVNKGIYDYIRTKKVTINGGKIAKNKYGVTLKKTSSISGYDCIGIASIVSNHTDKLKLSRFSVSTSGALNVRLTQHPFKDKDHALTGITVTAVLVYVKKGYLQTPQEDIVNINIGDSDFETIIINDDGSVTTNPKDVTDDEKVKDQEEINPQQTVPDSAPSVVDDSTSSGTYSFNDIGVEIYNTVRIDGTTTTLKGRVDNINREVFNAKRTDGTTTTLKGRVDDIEVEINNIGNLFSGGTQSGQLWSYVLDLRTRVQTLEGQVSALESDYNDLLERVRTLENHE